jgi:hypothetical protein
MFMVVMLFAVLMGMFAIMDMGVAVFAAVTVVMRVGMDAERGIVVVVIVVIPMIVRVGMHGAVFMDMGMFMCIFVHAAFDLRLACTATTNCTHRSDSSSILFVLPRTTRFLFP